MRSVNIYGPFARQFRWAQKRLAMRRRDPARNLRNAAAGGYLRYDRAY